MKDLAIKELIDLVIAEVPDPETKIQRMYEWHFERDMTITKWILGIAASLSISVLIAFFEAERGLVVWHATLVLLSALGTFTYGIYRLWQMRSLHRQFVSALKLLCELKKVEPFLARYRQEKGK